MDNKYLILVNKTHSMKNENNYEKVLCNSKYANNRTLEKDTYDAFLKLKDYIFTLGYIIDVESGYRSKEYQQKVWEKCVEEHGLEHTRMYVAVPGYSEHQTGLAVDVALYENGIWLEDQKQKEHIISDILAENAYKFGFIIRYPKGKENITGYGWEPWHLRYVKDIEVAKYIYENDLCLEEYLGRI